MSELPLPGGTAAGRELEENRPQPAATALPGRDLAQFEDVPMELAMELARVKITIRDLLELAPGSMLKLPTSDCDSLRVMLGKLCIASGEIASHDNCYAVRLLEIVDNADAHGDRT